jgi:hypothetical protein
MNLIMYFLKNNACIDIYMREPYQHCSILHVLTAVIQFSVRQHNADSYRASHPKRHHSSHIIVKFYTRIYQNIYI